MMNSVSIIGHVGADPQVRYTAEGTPVANFSIAVNEFYTDKAGEKQKRTQWFRVVAFSRLAEICSEYLQSGSKVAIRGQLTSRSWEDSEGNKHYTVEIRARELELLGKSNGTSNGNAFTEADDSDIPLLAFKSMDGLRFTPSQPEVILLFIHVFKRKRLSYGQRYYKV